MIQITWKPTDKTIRGAREFVAGVCRKVLTAIFLAHRRCRWCQLFCVNDFSLLLVVKVLGGSQEPPASYFGAGSGARVASLRSPILRPGDFIVLRPGVAISARKR